MAGPACPTSSELDLDTSETIDKAPAYRVVATPYTGESVARGVVACRHISRGELVETAHCIVIPGSEYKEHMRYTILEHYLFRCRSGSMLLALGVGSLFNHSQTPNLDYRIDQKNAVIKYFAAKDIEPEEELFIFYGSNLWFTDAKAPEHGDSSSTESDEEKEFMAGFNVEPAD